MNVLRLAIIFPLMLGVAQSQSARSRPLRFDLSKIGMVIDGRQVCEDVGRMQDVASKEMDSILAAGPKAIPVLISMISDSRAIKREEPIICYWGEMAVGDVAFCLLEDLFLGSDSRKTALPGASYEEILGPNPDKRSAHDQFYFFIRTHGRRALQTKWYKLWGTHKQQIVWNARERDFQLVSSR